MGDKTRRNSIVPDPELVERGLEATGLNTPKELVDFALRELIRRESQKKLLDLKGQVDWDGNLAAMRGDDDR